MSVELLYSLRYQTIQVIATALSYFMDCLFKMYSLIVCIIGLKEKLVQTGWYKNCGKQTNILQLRQSLYKI